MDRGFNLPKFVLFQARMKLYGITGGIGMGKSAAAALLRERGVPVMDSDEIARQIVEPGQPALAEIRAAFGGGVFNADGALNREAMARRVFADSDSRQKLEGILHPRIRAIWLAQVEAWRHEGQPVGVVVVPLLFETKGEAHCDETICIACTPATQQQRLQQRGWSAEQIRQRLNAQWSAEMKMSLADYVVWTEGGLDVHGEQLRRIVRVA